jgi:hypothetical protein
LWAIFDVVLYCGLTVINPYPANVENRLSS